MKLIEKKCPNCGGSLEFSETAKSCKCEYCHRAFEIERDEKIDVSDIAEQFNLSELEGPLKAFGIMHIVAFAFIFLVAVGIIGGVAYSMFRTQKEVRKEFDQISGKQDSSNEKVYISDISELTNDDYYYLDNEAVSKISRTAEGVNDTNHSYSMDGDLKREKAYVAGKDDDSTNVIVTIYKATYHDFFHQESRYTLYIPLVYENIKLKGFNKFNNPELKAPEYYFDSNKTAFTYGYGSLDEAINAVVKPLESDYKVTSK